MSGVEPWVERPPCARCGKPYWSHNVGAITTCPIISTYQPTLSETETVAAQGLDAATIEWCAQVATVAANIVATQCGSYPMAELLSTIPAAVRALNTASTTTRGEDARLRGALIRAALCLSGFVNEGICIEGYEEPDDVYLATVTLLGMEDADDDDLRAALQGNAAHTSQEKGNG